EDAPEMFFIGEYFVLHGQEDAGAIDDIDHRQMVFHRDLLETEVLFTCDRKPGTCFYGLVVGEDDELAVADISDAGNGAAGGTAALFFIELESGESAELDEWGILIQEIPDALTRRQLFFLVLLFYRRFSTSQRDLVQPGLQLADRTAHRVFVFVEIQGLRDHSQLLWMQFNMDAEIFWTIF